MNSYGCVEVLIELSALQPRLYGERCVEVCLEAASLRCGLSLIVVVSYLLNVVLFCWGILSSSFAVFIHCLQVLYACSTATLRPG